MLYLFLYAFLFSFVVLVFVLFLTHKHNLFIDTPNEKRPQNFHKTTTPRAGGVSILSGMFFVALIPLGLKFLPSIILAFLSGIFEDLHSSLSPTFRLFLQVIAALSAILLTDSVVTYLGLGISMPYSVGVFFSIFAIVGMMNAINIIDGFNGLASGIILLILISFSIVSYQHNNSEILSIIMLTMGATFSFLLLNFPKGKIFLGDGGAYLLGFIVAIIGISLASKYESVSPWYVMALFIYPVWEVLFSIMRKLSIGHSPLQPDTFHLHMLIYRQITHNNPLTALFIVLTTLPFMTLSTLFPNRSTTNIAIACCFILSYLMLYFYLYKKELKAP